MDTLSVLEKIQQENPRLVYLSGKTCTGKTTFAIVLEGQGYSRVELDKIVTRSVVIPFEVLPGDGFRAAYREDGPLEHTEAFIVSAKSEITERFKDSPLVIEGAVAKSRILKEIFSGTLGDFIFIYFHPINIDVYAERILTRFVAGARTNTSGLPKDFWTLVQEDDLKEVMDAGTVGAGITDAVRQYASKSMEESARRLGHLKESFPDIVVVEI